MTTFRILQADCIEAMAEMEENSVDAIVTDPPYGLEFMGKEWDRLGIAGEQHWHFRWATEALRVLKPGGHLLSFGGTRTYHRLTCALEDAGFKIRDCLAWLYGSGFPKSLDVSKAFDKAAGAEREVVGTERSPFRMADPFMGNVLESTQTGDSRSVDADGYIIRETTAPATPDAQRWQGWGTALKPAFEPIVLARKPLSERSVAANVQRWGTGALNIDGCRIDHADDADLATSKAKNPGRDDLVTSDVYGAGRPQQRVNESGRWPANVILDEQAAGMLDEQTGETVSRYFYQPKADREERNRGLEGMPRAVRNITEGHGRGPVNTSKESEDGIRTNHPAANSHPTVKPVALMQWLVRMVTPPGGVVLDPFTGSGTTGMAACREGFDFIGIEREPEYVEIARARILGDAPLFNVEVMP